jgi:uncharacterized lipoprotein YajG
MRHSTKGAAMTTFSIRRFVCGIALTMLTGTAAFAGCETTPAAQPNVPKAQMLRQTNPPKHVHTAGRDFETVY